MRFAILEIVKLPAVIPVFFFPIIATLIVENSVPDLILLKKGKFFGFINSKRQTVIALKYEITSLFSDGNSIVRLRKKRGIISRAEKEIPHKYDFILIRFTSSRLFLVELNKKNGNLYFFGREIL